MKPRYRQRIGDRTRAALWRERLNREAAAAHAQRRHPHQGALLRPTLQALLRGAGLWARGVRNANRPVLTHHVFEFEHLPAGFDGFRILLISDFHFDGRPGFVEAVCALVQPLEVDLCALTGDYPWRATTPCRWVYEGIEALLEVVTAPHGIFAVLGNNDSSALVEGFSQRGIRTLVNEAMAVRRGGDLIWVVGVDDPNDFQCDGLEVAVRDVPSDAFSLLLAHSPEVVAQAAALGIDLYLCGHTHGGQIRLPCLGPAITNAGCPRRYCHGRWRFGHLEGFTTSGIGTTAVPVRYNCPPEAAIIELRRGGSAG